MSLKEEARTDVVARTSHSVTMRLLLDEPPEAEDAQQRIQAMREEKDG